MSESTQQASSKKTYIVEHLDPELEQWSALEYKCIAQECNSAGALFLLSAVPPELVMPAQVANVEGLQRESDSVENLFAASKTRVCLLDPAASTELSPEDGDKFDYFLFGGILGDDPPRDRTSELRKKGFEGRRLGPVQMTTDTAVRVTRIVVQNKIALHAIPYIDHPEIRIDKYESTEMPFRYVKDDAGNPIMPEGMLEVIKKDSEKSLDELL